LAGRLKFLLVAARVPCASTGVVGHMAPDHRLHGTEEMVASGIAACDG
jgi:hypothetical protein